MRWANAGGVHREKYALYHLKKSQGVSGGELSYYHPLQADGYWKEQASIEGVLSPLEMKQQSASKSSSSASGGDGNG